MKKSLFLLAVVINVNCLFSQINSPIDPSRSIDWTKAGIPGGIPVRNTIFIALDSIATPNDINTAISNCPSGQVVFLNAGIYNLNSGIVFSDPKSDVVLRGAGPSKTILKFTGSGVNCFVGGENICIAKTFYGQNLQPGGTNAGDWTGGYTKGDTVITLNNVGANPPTPGTVLILDQANDQAAITSNGATEAGNTVTITTQGPHGYSVGNKVIIYNVGIAGYNSVPGSPWTISAVPTDSTFQYICTATGLSNSGAGSNYASAVVDPGGIFICDASGTMSTELCGNGLCGTGRIINGVTYSQNQFVNVTSITGSGSGPYQVGISPGLYAGNWRFSRHPGASWVGNTLNLIGIEDLTIDNTNTGINTKAGLVMENCSQCWVKNVRSIKGNRNHIWLINSNQDEIIDSYFYGTQHSAQQSYGVEMYGTGDILVQNNIFDEVTCPTMLGDGAGNVIAYNYGINNTYNPPPTWMQGSSIGHDAGNQMDLYEGNEFSQIGNDLLHGSSATGTIFRNLIPGWMIGKIQNTIPVEIDGGRGYNIVGNVLGTAGYHTNYESSTITGFTSVMTSVYLLGFAYDCVGGIPAPPVNDPLVVSTLMRWGNYDAVNKTVQWNTSEIPANAVPFINANAVPSNHILPTSLYLTSKPSWWPVSVSWPPIGPDVTNGNIPNTGGFANMNPAHICYLNTPIDASYQVTYKVNQASWNSATQTATITIGPNDLNPSDVVMVSGINPSGYNGTFNVSAETATTISYDMLTDPGIYSNGGVFKFPNILNFNGCTSSVSTDIPDNLKSTAAIEIYPNPAQDKIYLDVTGTFTRVVVSIYSVNGKNVAKKIMNLKTDKTLDVSSLSSGMYFVQIADENFNSNQKVIINR